jgi:SAM-dependent methyltransferase
MSRISLRTLFRESWKTLRRPRRLLQLLDTQRLLSHLRAESIRDIVRETWTPARRQSGLSHRQYDRYEDYLAHQRDKLPRISRAKMDDYHERFRAALRARLELNGCVRPGLSVLCLAARRGTEVIAFTDLGCFAVGIDLNPGSDNRHVLPGDFHAVQFADESVDIVFTNSLDHAFDLDRLLSEIRRVLKPGGLLIVEAARGSSEGLAPGFYESCWWARIDDLVAGFERSAFTLLERSTFAYPWAGEHLCFQAPGAAVTPEGCGSPVEVRV